MKIPFLALLVTLFAVFALAASSSSPEKAFIVSFPDETPQSVLDDAKASIKSAGGYITHEYKLIKAFAAKASSAAIESIQTYSTKYNAVIEDDQLVHANGDAF